MKWYLQCLKRYAHFKGRARRSEFWFFYLIQTGIYVTLFFVGFFLSLLFEYVPFMDVVLGIWGLLYFFYMALTFLPTWAVTVRRLHDVGMSGWWLPVLPLVFIGSIIVLPGLEDEWAGLLALLLLGFSGVVGLFLFIRLVKGGEVAHNRYGENPKKDENISAIFT